MSGVAEGRLDGLIGIRRLVGADGQEGPAWLRVENGAVVERGDGEPVVAPSQILGVVVPGAIDTHVHGAVGIDLATPGVDPQPALDHHHRAGSTTLIASLATGEIDDTRSRVRELAPLVREGRLAGLHLEGPWLAPARRGAHNPRLLREPSRADVADLLAAGDGAVRMVTIAPELPGAFEAIDELVSSGVVVAVGHTDADAETVSKAIDSGARVVTHLFNGMPPMHHRRAGTVGVSLSDDRVTVELIADGEHVGDVVLDVARRAAGGRMVLVSDAMSATGLGDGSYDLAGSEVVVSNGVATLVEGNSLAGSTTELMTAACRLIARDIPLPEVVAVSSATAAGVFGLRGHGLRPGEPADLVELDLAPGSAAVSRVARRGVWLG
ncbi:amidohydrolase family protein [Kineosporia sp. J2-2]|uniref:Amidohydrolase family protein n=1 Tax=Kineosporia corallincola TaxID=2835133 RepID=A0ABS5TE74_9ACTN|nr:amidohydrolase family protein [Kineosporia corallincola]MBT0769163.1 amidohydrolase family protein [Kineosporia corallincola]